MVTQSFDVLNVYGKTTDQLNYIVKAFILVLEAYPPKDVRDAFLHWISRKSVMPTPADIVNIIDPPPEKLSEALFINLCKKRDKGIYLTPDERRFIYAFEQQELTKSVNFND
jgi:hypothetical protein